GARLRRPRTAGRGAEPRGAREDRPPPPAPPPRRRPAGRPGHAGRRVPRGGGAPRPRPVTPQHRTGGARSPVADLSRARTPPPAPVARRHPSARARRRPPPATPGGLRPAG